MVVTDVETAIAKSIKSGDSVFIHGGQMMPTALVNELVNHSESLDGVETVHLHLEGPVPFVEELPPGKFKVSNLFVGGNTRSNMLNGGGSYTPASLSVIPKMMREGDIPVDAALLSVSEPDAHGRVSLGTSVDVAYAAFRSANVKVAQVRKGIPNTMGISLDIKDFDYVVESESPIPSPHVKVPSEDQEIIAELVADEIGSGSTVQMGIGAISSMLASKLHNHHNLSIWSEMITDSVIDLVESGDVVGPVTTSFAVGTLKLWRVVNNNHHYQFLPIENVNGFNNIASRKNFCAVNNITQVDLLGNSNCDQMGNADQYSGIGGQMDFTHGAMYSEGGKSFLCLKSRTSSGKSRISLSLPEGVASTIPRNLVDYVVTEQGIVRLKGLNIHQRIKAMISIAHPEERERLEWQSALTYGTRGNVYTS